MKTLNSLLQEAELHLETLTPATVWPVFKSYLEQSSGNSEDFTTIIALGFQNDK